MQGVKPEISAIRKGLVRELGSRRFQDALKKLDDKEYIKFCLDIMEFCLPKLQRTEVTGDEGKDLTIKIIRDSPIEYTAPISEAGTDNSEKV